mmetsp:Transcript_33712/g.100092  ORF Transcript_33712/g.100092 Transcript_33712/m.100092 type:complete len:269 (-) Transcript_33712:21-827(-)
MPKSAESRNASAVGLVRSSSDMPGESSPAACSSAAGVARFTSTHLPPRRWVGKSRRTASDAAQPCAPPEKRTKPKPRDLLVRRSTITTASATAPYWPKYALRSSVLTSCGRPPTKILFEVRSWLRSPGTARFTSTRRLSSHCCSWRTAAAAAGASNVTKPKPRGRPFLFITTASTMQPYLAKWARRASVVVVAAMPPTNSLQQSEAPDPEQDRLMGSSYMVSGSIAALASARVLAALWVCGRDILDAEPVPSGSLGGRMCKDTSSPAA